MPSRPQASPRGDVILPGFCSKWQPGLVPGAFILWCRTHEHVHRLAPWLGHASAPLAFPCIGFPGPVNDMSGQNRVVYAANRSSDHQTAPKAQKSNVLWRWACRYCYPAHSSYNIFPFLSSRVSCPLPEQPSTETVLGLSFH